MLGHQSIYYPVGITVSGSAVIQVEPDLVVVQFAVSHRDPDPRKAFAGTRAIAQKVNVYLSGAKIEDFGSSRISLDTVFRRAGETDPPAYLGRVDFRVVLHDLDRIEEVLSDILDAGVSNIWSVGFQTTRLEELRAEAQRQAVAAAREKAEIYCQAAGVKLGDVVHIEDATPDQLPDRGGGGLRGTLGPGGDGAPRAFEPGSIVVEGKVIVSFRINQQKE